MELSVWFRENDVLTDIDDIECEYNEFSERID